MLISYATERIRRICESFAEASEVFNDKETSALKATLSDILAANHIGELMGINISLQNEMANNVFTGTLVINSSISLACTFRSTLNRKSNVPLETFRRLRIEQIGNIK